MIIFFDWDNKGSSGPQDGQSDHVGIVQKVENGIVYTVEGSQGRREIHQDRAGGLHSCDKKDEKVFENTLKFGLLIQSK